jgi:hypothetical protein
MTSQLYYPCVWVFIALLTASIYAASESKPHGHRGLAPRFTAGMPNVTLTEDDIKKLKNGAVVHRQFLVSGSGIALAVQDVIAPPAVVLDRILDFAHYPKMVDGVVVRTCRIVFFFPFMLSFHRPFFFEIRSARITVKRNTLTTRKLS